MPLVTVTEPTDNLDVSVRKLQKVTVLSGESVVRGEVMKGTAAYAAATAVTGTNTGNATIAGEVASDDAQSGVYTIEALTATTFKVITPDGLTLDAVATAGAAYDDQIGFTITAGGTPMVAGDSFTIAVTVGLGKVASFTTGATPLTIMYEDVDASLGDVAGWAYLDADVKATEVDFGTGTDAEVRRALGAVSIYLMD